MTLSVEQQLSQERAKVAQLDAHMRREQDAARAKIKRLRVAARAAPASRKPPRVVVVNTAPQRNAANELVLPPIRAAAGVEVWYRERLQGLVRDMAQSLLLHLRAAWGRADPSIGFAADAANFERRPDRVTAELKRALRKWGVLWTDKLERASEDIARMFASRNQRNLDVRFRKILKDAGFTVEFRPTAGAVTAYRAVIAEQVNLIKSIPQKFLTDVQTSVWDTVMRGGDMSALSASIKRNYGVTWRRAAFIARDQTNKARAIMEEARRSELGIEEAVWHHSHAGREPRPTHVDMDGKRYKIAEGMWDPAVDKYVWPGTEPNCRCSSRAIIPAFRKAA